MAGRKPGAGGSRRLIELVKDALIVLLTCSAVLLAGQTPMFKQVRGWIAPLAQISQPPAWQSGDAVIPSVICTRNSRGLYGVSYDNDLLVQTFNHLSPFLGEGLATAGAPERVGSWQWRGLLESPGIYCAFQGEPPLEALCAWLGKSETSGNLIGGVQSLTLARLGEQVWLAWQSEDGTHYRAKTEVAYEGYLESVLEEYNPNGAAYAYALAQEDSTYATLAPFELVSLSSPYPQSWLVSAPDFAGNREELESLLNALGFHSGVGTAYESGDDLAINEGSDRLRVTPSGSVTFRAGDEMRYPVPSDGGSPSAAQAALAAWNLLNRAVAPWKGETSYLLTTVEQQPQGWVVTFQSRLDGIRVLTGEEGWCARFTVTGGEITDFTLLLRKYTPAGTVTLLPSQRLAAAALNSIPESNGQLVLCYPDTGNGIMEAIWRTETPDAVK